MQLKLKFPIKRERKFEISFQIGKRWCAASRENNGTFLSVGGLNFLGDYSGVMFRASNLPLSDGFFNYIIPDLHELSLEEIKLFAQNIVYLHETHQTDWDYEHRKTIFNLSCGHLEKEYKLDLKSLREVA